MRALLFALCFLCAHCSSAQGGTQAAMHDSSMVYVFVPNPPFFFQGTIADYVQENLKYPDSARMMGYEGRVNVSFVVDEQGFVTGAEVKQGVHRWLDEEALRIVREMPRWAPGHKDGKYVKVRMALPIRFTLVAPDEKKAP